MVVVVVVSQDGRVGEGVKVGDKELQGCPLLNSNGTWAYIKMNTQLKKNVSE